MGEIPLCRTAYTAVYHSLSPMRGFVFYLWIINWTNLSNGLDTFVQFAHAIRLICFPTEEGVASLPCVPVCRLTFSLCMARKRIHFIAETKRIAYICHRETIRLI